MTHMKGKVYMKQSLTLICMLFYCNRGWSVYHIHIQGKKKLWESYNIMLNFRYFCNTDHIYLERSEISNMLHDILHLCMTYVTLENTSL